MRRDGIDEASHERDVDHRRLVDRDDVRKEGALGVDTEATISVRLEGTVYRSCLGGDSIEDGLRAIQGCGRMSCRLCEPRRGLSPWGEENRPRAANAPVRLI